MFGDEQQLGTFSGRPSLAAVARRLPEVKHYELNRTYRLSNSSLLPLTRFYPSLTAVNPNQGIRCGELILKGCVLVNFRSDAEKCDTSVRATQEFRYIQQLARQLQSNRIDVLLASPYTAQAALPSADSEETRVHTINAIQGLECEVTIISLTNRAMTEFQLQPERLIVAISRATKATIIVGEVNRLCRSVSWFRQSPFKCPFKLLQTFKNNNIETF
jgi:hypothetical protein